jgi:hypothetical protein
LVLQLEEEGRAEERPLLSYRELLLTHEFIVAALTAGLSFCAMTALMSVTPIAMRVRGCRARAAGVPAGAGASHALAAAEGSPLGTGCWR